MLNCEHFRICHTASCGCDILGKAISQLNSIYEGGGVENGSLTEGGSDPVELGWLLRCLWRLSMYLKDEKYFERKEERLSEMEMLTGE